MRKYLYILLSIAILSGCSSPMSFLKKGQYDIAVRKAVKKIRKKPTHVKSIDVLTEAYPKANDIDMERINFLRKEGKPDVWDEIFNRYSAMKDRQSLVKSVYPLKHPYRTINYTFVDYDNEVIQAKKRAAEYFYVHGKKLLNNGDKASAREAYAEFMQVKRYYRDYEDVDELILKAREMGISYALVKVKNSSHIKLPREFKTDLIKHDYSRINREWVEYDAQERTGLDYDYNVLINIKIIDVSPEGLKEEHITESKEIADGFEYALDANGNVMKDSLGNDIKIPKRKTITCHVIKIFQHKAVHMEGTIDYINNFTGKVLKSVPIAADNFFDHAYAIANGDFDALTSSSKKLIGIKPLPFPADFDMIFMAGDILKKVSYDALYGNKRTLN